ncbi:MAG: hypothetical protein LBV05_12745 [Comamonas sp.]|jgi:hypothetical protein|uniref:hypothetical protein n=1 Tax=Comamonas sp. TaxID=34028 RepID=UPI00283F1592|nr:hypothetical protein [Comamonas sp.]MDR3066354.1 hypothetical protein [Comamonas sp.]
MPVNKQKLANSRPAPAAAATGAVAVTGKPKVDASAAASVVEGTQKVYDAKTKKQKLVRDSFTIPKDEYEGINRLKLRAASQGHLIKKSELLRAGLKLLSTLDDKQLLVALEAVPLIKTGRPPKTEAVTSSLRTVPAKAKKAAKAP